MRVSMKTLEAFVTEQNNWNAIFKMPPMTMPLSQASVTDLAKSIDAKLSPENLHCDGEISRAEAQRKYNHLHTVLKQLRSYADKNGMTMPEMWEA
tara:strand:+ start:346 stop:630 length:285 start_codon:yes stop_codon:yes gene_type:complete